MHHAGVHAIHAAPKEWGDWSKRHIACTNDEIMSLGILDTGFFVCADPLVLVVPLSEQQADRPFHQLRQITIDEASVLPGELDLASKRQIIAYEDLQARDDASREWFVVWIPQAHHPAIIVARLSTGDLHETEVAMTVLRETMRLRANLQICGCQCILHRLNECWIAACGSAGEKRSHIPAPDRDAGCTIIALHPR
jgi:hypothetical protein